MNTQNTSGMASLPSAVAMFEALHPKASYWTHKLR